MVAVRCWFSVRTPLEGGYSYERVHIDGPEGSSHLITEHPPLIGDKIDLPPGLCRVADRNWRHPMYGSANWPYGELRAKVGPVLDIVVEQCEGMFSDEVARSDHGEEP